MKLILTLCFCIPVFAQAQSLTGKVISGNKPDAGSKVYVVKYDDGSRGMYDTLNNFMIAKSYRGLYADSIAAYTANKALVDKYEGKKRFADEYAAIKPMADREKALLDDATQKIQSTGAVTKELFESLDHRSSAILSKAKYYPGNITAVVDASGTYTANLPAGKYFVLIISNDRAGFTATEVAGKLFMQQFDIKEGETKNISTRFVMN